MSVRSAFLKHLTGRGVEFGALHNPLALDPAHCRVEYVDKLTKAEALRHFPELAPVADRIVEPDAVLNVDSREMLQLADRQFDFVIANHLIEHMVNPIRFLENVAAILKPDGVLYLAVPIKDRTFDINRALTTNDHLWTDYRNDESEISIEHLNDFLLNMTKDHIDPARRAWMYFKDDVLPSDPAERERIYDIHRRRSIHVHVWDRTSFDGFLAFATAQLSLPLAVVDAAGPDATGNEAVYVLRRTAAR